MPSLPRDLASVEFRPDGKPYVIREARTLRELDEVHRITHDSIVTAGYMTPQRGGRIITYPALDPSPLTTILIAIENGAVIGTNSITADGPLGLPTDLHFPRETDAVRREGRRLVSSFRIATDPTWPDRHTSALALDIVKWTAFVAIHRYRFETMLCTFNPKHEVLYRRLLDAETIARIDDLGGGDIRAGAVMMRIERDSVLRKLGRELDQLAQWHCPDPSMALALTSVLRPPATTSAPTPPPTNDRTPTAASHLRPAAAPDNAEPA